LSIVEIGNFLKHSLDRMIFPKQSICQTLFENIKDIFKNVYIWQLKTLAQPRDANCNKEKDIFPLKLK